MRGHLAVVPCQVAVLPWVFPGVLLVLPVVALLPEELTTYTLHRYQTYVTWSCVLFCEADFSTPYPPAYIFLHTQFWFPVNQYI